MAVRDWPWREPGNHWGFGSGALDPSDVSCYRPPALRRPREVLPPTHGSRGACAGVALFALLALALPAAGCGPIEYVNQVSSKAASAVAAAKAVRADRHAPYEYTAAEEYLHKAREEAGHSAFQVAIDYGRKAEELADKARALSLEKSGQTTEGPPPSERRKP